MTWPAMTQANPPPLVPPRRASAPAALRTVPAASQPRSDRCSPRAAGTAPNTYASGNTSERRPTVDAEVPKCRAVAVARGAKVSHAIWLAEATATKPAIGAQRLRVLSISQNDRPVELRPAPTGGHGTPQSAYI